jgi:hypothetical protein
VKGSKMTIKEAFQKAVKDRVGNDKDHGWGQADSLHVIETLIIEECGVTKEDIVDLMDAISNVVNPSAFRQKLESANILNKGSKTEKKASKLLEGW